MGAASAAASAGPADNDDAALSGGTLSDNDLKDKMMELLGEEIMTGLQVTTAHPLVKLSAARNSSNGINSKIIQSRLSCCWERG
jgi:hypothetical protein